VFEACYLQEEWVAKDHRKLTEEVAQGILLDDPDFLKEIVERVLQEVLEAEMTEHIGAAPYERTTERKGHRNGHKPRTLRTRVGALNLLVPEDVKKGPSRRGCSRVTSATRTAQREGFGVGAHVDVYVEGVSTRMVKDVIEELCGTSFSKSLASPLAGRLDAEELESWRSRPLEAQGYPYVFVDTRDPTRR
jgi:putative transposase